MDKSESANSNSVANSHESFAESSHDTFRSSSDSGSFTTFDPYREGSESEGSGASSIYNTFKSCSSQMNKKGGNGSGKKKAMNYQERAVKMDYTDSMFLSGEMDSNIVEEDLLNEQPSGDIVNHHLKRS